MVAAQPSSTGLREARDRASRARFATLIQRQGALIALVVTMVFGWARYGGDGFTGSYNITEALRYNAMFALIALGMTFVIMTGGIDLSVGAVVVLGSVMAARASGDGPWVATLVAIGTGLAFGFLNGVLISRFRIQPFIVTLATLLGGRGLALLAANNSVQSLSTEAFTNGFIELSGREIGPLPLPAVIAIVAFLIGSVLLNLTRFGRHVLAIGGNEEAARLAGVPIDRTIIVVYVLSGGLAGLAGAILAAYTFSGNPNEAVGWELSAIAAVVVGGTLLTGGLGSVWSTLVGVLLLGAIINMLNFESLDPYWQQVVRGVFLLVVVVLQSRLRRPASA
ncbi:MAG: ABC transporter permease [Thermomicrobiales bacterium]